MTSVESETNPSLAERIAPAKAALIIVDMQNDYVAPDGALMVWQKERWADLEGYERTLREVMPALRRLASKARSVGAIVFWTKTVLTPTTDSKFWRSQEQETCREGTWGAEIYDELKPEPGDVMLTKTRHSAYFGTNLDSILRVNQIEGVIVTGVGTPGCVESTVRDAMTLDYWAVVPSDCCGTGDLLAHEASLLRISRLFGMVTDSESIIDAWNPTPQVSDAMHESLAKALLDGGADELEPESSKHRR